MSYYLLLALTLLGYMTFWFFISIFKKRNDVADIAWGLGFVFMAWLSLFLSGFFVKAILVTGLVTVWGRDLPGIFTIATKINLKIHATWNGKKPGIIFT